MLVWLQDERAGLRRELQATRDRLAAAEAAVATASSGTALAVTTDRQLAVLNHKLSAARWLPPSVLHHRHALVPESPNFLGSKPSTHSMCAHFNCPRSGGE